MTGFDPAQQFPEFYGNPHIRALAGARRWTVSTQEPTEQFRTKTPIDMRCLLDGGTGLKGQPLAPGTLRGAFATDETCLVPLTEMSVRFPNASNVALYLRSAVDGYTVLDIEKDCPPEEAARLLSVPGALYSEVSMSGRGFHLLMPVPANTADHPIGATKRVLKHPQGWWEVLMEHWVTFTRRPIPDDLAAQMAALAPAQPPTWEQVWAEVAAEAVPNATVTVDIEHEAPDIPHADALVRSIVGSGHGRTMAAFGHDTSRFEFAVLGVYWVRLEKILSTLAFPPGTDVESFTDSARAWLIYRAAVHALPHRDKHDETRNGLPYLLDRAVAMAALSRSRESSTSQQGRRRR